MITLQPAPLPDLQAAASTPEPRASESPMPVFDSAGLLQGGREY